MLNCQHQVNERENCTGVDTNQYSDLRCTWGIYSIIYNHSITNQIDQFHMLFMFTFIIALYLYQCMKLYNFFKNTRFMEFQNHRKSLEFQLLFWIWTLMKLIQLSYTYIGFQVDQSKLWKLRALDSKNQTILIKQNYCDHELRYEMDESQQCYVRYEINGFLMYMNLYVTIVVIQMIIFFWQKQIYPSMFIRLFKVLFNIHIPLRIKICHLIFFIIDIIILAYNFVLWIFINCTMHWPTNEPIQYFFPIVTLTYFVYTIWDLHHNGERLYLNQKLIAICTTCFLLVRIIFLFTIQFVFGGTQIIDEYRKTPFLYFFSQHKFIHLTINQPV